MTVNIKFYPVLVHIYMCHAKALKKIIFKKKLGKFPLLYNLQWRVHLNAVRMGTSLLLFCKQMRCAQGRKYLFLFCTKPKHS